MSRTSLLNFSAPIFISLLSFALPAFADEPLVKLSPTPMPAAGPTVAAAQEFCGEPTGKAEELIERYASRPGLKEVYKSDQYVAYSDDDKNSSVMYTFTAKGHPAYPAAVCRKPVQEGDNLVIKMAVVCDGETEACNKLRNDFNVMTAKMQAEVDQQIAAQKK
jgi:hypothetical protein